MSFRVNGVQKVRRLTAVACRTAHEFRQLVVDLRRVEDLFFGPSVSELGVRIVRGVFVILGRWSYFSVLHRRNQMEHRPIFARCSIPPPYLSKYS